MAGAAVAKPPAPVAYRLEDQVGFQLRRAGQRHAAIFAEHMGDDLTPTQWAALIKLAEFQSVSQNLLGRETAMDAATIKGVVDRLCKRGLVATAADPADARRMQVSITSEGRLAIASRVKEALEISARTLDPLDPREQRLLLDLLRRIA